MPASFHLVIMLTENIINYLRKQGETSLQVNHTTIMPQYSGFTGDLLVAIKDKSGLSWNKIATRMGVSDTKLRKFKNKKKYTSIPFFDAIKFCIACDLDLKNTEFVLSECNYALSEGSVRDKLIKIVLDSPAASKPERDEKIACIDLLEEKNVFNYNTYNYLEKFKDFLKK